MNPKLKMLMILACILITTNAVARDTVTITPLDNPTIQQYGPSTAGLQVGNLNPPAFLLGGWFWGDEEYKYLFDPSDITCPNGFLLQNVHMVVDFDSTMVPVTFDVWCDLEDAFYDAPANCWVPGVEDCRSSTFTVTITTPGTYDLSIPIDCQCAYKYDSTGLPYMYMLSMHFIGIFNMNLVADNMPTPCTAYNNWGSGWYDLYQAFSTAGNIIMYGDVACCDNPIPDAEKTWSGIKSLYE